MKRALGLGVRLAIGGLVIGAITLSATSPLGPVGLVALPYLGVGALLVARRPETSIGWILVGVGACYTLLSMPVTADARQFAEGTVDTPVLLFAIVHAGLGTTSFFLFAVLMIVFPSGRLPAGRWGRLARAALGTGLIFAASAYVMPEISVGYPVSAWVPNPIALLPEVAIWQVLTPSTAIIPVMILMAAGAISLFVRARHAAGVERQQLRWIAASFVLVISAVLSGFVIGIILVPSAGESGLAWIPVIFAFPLPPIAIGIAVLRYRLYDIDRIISRTISYGVCKRDAGSRLRRPDPCATGPAGHDHRWRDSRGGRVNAGRGGTLPTHAPSNPGRRGPSLQPGSV